MNRFQKFELIYVKSTLGFLALCAIYVILQNFMAVPSSVNLYNVIGSTVFFIVFTGLTLVKPGLIKSGVFANRHIYFIAKFIEIFLIVFGVVFIGTGNWGFYFIVFTVMVATLQKGNKNGLILIFFWFLNDAILYSAQSIFLPKPQGIMQNFLTSAKAFEILLYLGICILIILLCGFVYRDGELRERENSKLLEELEEKYSQFAVAQDEIKIQYDKLKDSNIKLEETNKKLTSSIAEFYTLQQISQAISSIFDIKELLRYVNDIILGVMGVNNSTIILFDDKKRRLKVHTTSLKNRDELASMTDNINSEILMGVLNNGKPIIENFVDSDEYSFTQGREVKSLICIPLNTKSRKFGLVLIEHKYYNAFDEENLRLLDIIGQQVGIAMENAELYQQMQELATIDGLTGVYNRLYFHERMQKEFKNAQEGNYELSLAIFDIDYFKRFNDTFGHLFGDKVLKSIADLVKNSLRHGDILARFGGEEFIILFPRTTLQEAYEKVEALRDKISKNVVKDSLVTAAVTVSFGISSFPGNSMSELELVRDADDALYEAKKFGRNCVKVAKKP